MFGVMDSRNEGITIYLGSGAEPRSVGVEGGQCGGHEKAFIW